jgi:hypothetical protein
VGCSAPVGEITLGMSTRFSPHHCDAVTDAAHVELVAEALAVWQAAAPAGCITATVEAGEPHRAPHNVNFSAEGPSEGSLKRSSEIYESQIAAHGAGTSVRAVLLHELGHHFGLAHSAEPDSVMFADLSGRNPQGPTAADVAALAELCAALP